MRTITVRIGVEPSEFVTMTEPTKANAEALERLEEEIQFCAVAVAKDSPYAVSIDAEIMPGSGASSINGIDRGWWPRDVADEIAPSVWREFMSLLKERITPVADVPERPTVPVELPPRVPFDSLDTTVKDRKP